MGKSTAMSHLILKKHSQFDLIIAFVGNKYCQPCLGVMMEKQFDDRFFFETWNVNLINRLLAQQTKLLEQNQPRNVLIVMDDCVLNNEASEQLAHLAMRGRHFKISLMTASVSYTAINKRVRRSLDYLFVFSCPMMGDMKVLSFEYTQNMNTALFGLKNLEEHTCMVFETCKKQQKLLNWKAKHITPEQIRSKPSLACAESEILEGKSLSNPPKNNDHLKSNKSLESSSNICEKNTTSDLAVESETVI